jgi:hypothetical protein
MSQPKTPTETINEMSSDDVAKTILEKLGLTIEKLKEPGNRKEADFLAHYENEVFIIEAKLRGDEKKELSRRENTLSKGGIYLKDETSGRDNTVSGALSNARNQIISSANNYNHDLRIIFHLSKGINAKAKCEIATDTLLGRTNILDFKSGSCKPCYFFSYSDFYTFRHAFDAAIVGYLDSKLHINVYANPHSPRYQKTKESKFLALLKIRDPFLEESQGKAYIPDFDVSVKEPAEVLRNICNKYNNSMLQKFDFNTPEIAIRVNVDSNAQIPPALPEPGLG